MSHPLFALARRLEERVVKRRTTRAMKTALADPHIARDVGLPYRPNPMVRVDRW